MDGPQEQARDAALPDDRLARLQAELDQLRSAFERLLADTTDGVGGASATRLRRAEDELRRLRAEVAKRDDELRSTRRSLRETRRAAEQLEAWVDQLSTEFRKLVASNRWQVGDRIGSVMERARPGATPQKATERAERVVAAFEDWRGGGGSIAATSPPTGDDDADGHGGPLPGLSLEELAADEPGVLASHDRARRHATYERWIAEVETSPPARTGTTRVHAIVVADVGGDQAAQGLALRTTVESCLAVSQAVTVLTSTVSPTEALVRDLRDRVAVRDARLAETLVTTDADAAVVLLPGDRVAAGFADGIAEALAVAPDAAAVVLDHDTIGHDGVRRDPCFGGAFDPDLVIETDVVGRAAAFVPSALADLDLTDVDAAGRDLTRDVLLRLDDAGRRIAKLDRVLVHHRPDTRRRRQVLDGDEAFARRVLARRGDGSAEVERTPWGLRVVPRPTGEPLVSIVVPFRDRPDLTRACVESIRRVTTYPNWELLLVDNRSVELPTTDLVLELTRDPRIRVVAYDAEFNYSKLNNWAVDRCHGDVLVFLNNDTKVVTPDWLERLVGWVQTPGVGSAGGRLHFADGRVQHAGIVIGLTGFGGHAYAGEHVAHHPEAARLRHASGWSAVTGALLAVARQRFDEVGRFDERFLVTGQDVELGLRLGRHGYRNVVDPDVVAFHFEKQSRSVLPTQRVDQLLSLETYLPELRDGDPHWNRNLSRWSAVPTPRVEDEAGYDELVEKVRGDTARRRLNIGEPGFLRRYDVSLRQLERNAEHVARFRADRRIDRLERVTWFVPAFDHVYRGGIYTIFRFADHFTRQRGTRSQVVIVGKETVELDPLRAEVAAAFPQADIELLHLGLEQPETELPPADIGVATLWTGAYNLLRYEQCRGKFYLVQDYEPSFYAGNTMQGLVKQTYRFGFAGIANTPGVGEAYAAFGNDVCSFTPAVDRHVFHPRDDERHPDAPIQIVFYGRPRNERNGFELGVQALTEVKRRFGDGVRIVSVGAAFLEGEYDLDGVLDNYGVLPNIESVADLYRRSDIGLVFMFSRHPSYQPLEYMASGCATVTNVNEANDWLYRDRENVVLAPPTVTAVADAISELVEDASLRAKVVAGGLATIEPLAWEPELDRVLRFIETGEHDG